MWLFYYFNFEKNHDILKLKNPYSSWNKNVSFNKNETGSKMENSTHSFREMNLVFQLTLESQIKIVMSWSSQKNFLYRLFCPKDIF